MADSKKRQRSDAERNYKTALVSSGREWGRSGGYNSRDFYDKSVEEHLVSADELMKDAKGDPAKYLSSWVRLKNAYQKVEDSSSLDDTQKYRYLAAIETRAERLAKKIERNSPSQYRHIAEDAAKLRDWIRKRRKKSGLERTLAIFAFTVLGMAFFMVAPALTGAVIGVSESVSKTRSFAGLIFFVIAFGIIYFLVRRIR